MDQQQMQAAAAAVLSRLGQTQQAPQQQQGGPPQLPQISQPQQGGGGGGGGPLPGMDLMQALARRIQANTGGNPNYTSGHQGGFTDDFGNPSPVGLLEHQDFPALAQYERGLTPSPTGPPMVQAPYGGGDRTMMSPNDHIGLSELAQGSLLDQLVQAIQRRQMPGSSPNVPLFPNVPNTGGSGRVVLQPQTTPQAPTWSRRVTT